MSASVIGALRVVIGADTAALDKGLADASSRLGSFSSSMMKSGAVAATAFAAAGAALAYSVKGVITEADKLGKMSQKIGVPVEELSALSLAAALSDVSMESLGKSVGKLSKTMVEAAAKPTSDAANAFKALGVSVTDSDGKLKSSTAVMGDIAGKFEGLKDGAGKTAVSMAIFGKSGAEMIPLLNSGKAGLKEMSDEAAKLGLVISTETTKAAERFNDNLTRLTKVKEGLIIKVAAGMLPAFERLSFVMIDNVKSSSSMDNIVRTLTNSMNLLVSAGIIVGAAFSARGSVIGGVSSALALVAQGKFTEALTALKTGFTNVGTTAIAAKNAVEGLWDPMKNFSAWAGDGMAKPVAALGDFNYKLLAAKQAFDNFIDSTNKSTASTNAEALTVGTAAGAKERLKVVLQGLALQQASGIALTDAQWLSLYKVGDAAGQAALKLQGMQLILAAKDPWVQFQTELANSDAAMRKAGATAAELAAGQEIVAKKFGMTWEGIGSNIAGTAGALSQLSGTFAKENKAMGIASKAFGIGQAIINTQIAITKAMASLPPPASYVAVALAVAQGAAAVASISAQKFATGGSFQIGGTGGVDSQLVPMMVTPGERVHVEQNKYGENGSGSGGTVNLTLNGRSFARDEVRELLVTVQNLVNDGYKLQLA